MNCPRCAKEPLIAIEHDRVELDYCPACHGVWLDAGELELLYGDADAAQDFLRSRNPVPRGEAPRKCPECGGRMIKEVTEGERPVIYDRCRKGHGLWLDHGELAAVLESATAAAGDKEVVTFLKQVFAGSPNAR